MYQVYLVADVPEMLTVLGLEQLLYLLPTLDDRLVELLLHDRAVTPGPLDRFRLISRFASLTKSE